MNKNKHILVTGATGYLGPDIVKGLLNEQYKITSISRHDFDISELNSKMLNNFEHIMHDIQEKKELSKILHDVTSRKGNFDGVVIMANKGTRQIDLNEHEDLFIENLSLGPKTTYITITSTLEFLNKKASIIIFGSIWGVKTPFQKMYLDLPIEPSLSVPASKSALIQLAKSFAAELAKDGIRVNLLTPGWFPKPGKVERTDYIYEITSRTPLGRIGVPNDLVGPVKFLLNESSGFITGHNLMVDGGFSLY